MSTYNKLKKFISDEMRMSLRHNNYKIKLIVNDSCIFCDIEKSRIVLSNKLALSFRDNFPVTSLHTLIIPKRHVKDYFELTRDEVIACNEIIKQLKEDLIKEDPAIEGFNIGMNSGEVAGQTIFHCHIHLIPRRKGDVENPRGGIRHIIPGKGFY